MKVIYCKPLFATTYFRDLSERNWFAPTNFCDQELYPHLVFFYIMPEMSATMSSREARKKVVLQYDFNIFSIITEV